MTTARAENPTPGRLQRIFAGKDASFFYYLAARVLGGVLSVITLRAIVGYLSREEYGDWGYLASLSAMMIPILSLSLPQAMMRHYFDHKESDLSAQRSLVTTVFRINVGAVLLLVAVEALLYLGGVHSPHEALFFGGATTGVLLGSFFNHLTRTRNDFGLFFFNRMADAAGFLGLVALAAHTGAEFAGGHRLPVVAICFAAALWFSVLASMGYYARTGLLHPKAPMLPRSEIKALLQFSLPLCPTFFVSWALSSSDVYLLRKLSTRAETADFVFAVGIVSILGVVSQSALLDWPRFFYKMMRDGGDDRDELIGKRARWFLWLHVATICGTRAIASYAYELFGATAYRKGLDFLGLLMLGNFFLLAGNLFSVGLGYAKKTRLTLVGFAIPAALSFSVNLLLVPRYGAIGAACTNVVSYTLFALLMLLLGRAHYRFRGARAFALVVVAAVAAATVPLPYAR